MSGTDEARFHPHGSCDLYDVFEERVTHAWISLAEWAADWIAEARGDVWGDAHDFIEDAIHGPTEGVVPALVELARATNGDEALLGWVGAGPIESLVSHSGNGDATLRDVERAARQEPLFRAALGNVWLGEGVSEAVKRQLSRFGAVVLGDGPRRS